MVTHKNPESLNHETRRDPESEARGDSPAPVREKDEIQAAHDRLVAIILGEVPSPWPAGSAQRVAMHAACDVLCWVLGHNHNETFADTLRLIDDCLAEHGLTLHKAEAPFTYDDLRRRTAAARPPSADPSPQRNLKTEGEV